MAADQLPKLAQLRDRLTERLAAVRGAAVEDNVFSVSVHYRNCDPGDVPAVRGIDLVPYFCECGGVGCVSCVGGWRAVG